MDKDLFERCRTLYETTEQEALRIQKEKYGASLPGLISDEVERQFNACLKNWRSAPQDYFPEMMKLIQHAAHNGQRIDIYLNPARICLLQLEGLCLPEVL